MTDTPSAADTVLQHGEGVAQRAWSLHIAAIHIRLFVESTSQSLQKKALPHKGMKKEPSADLQGGPLNSFSL
jgi:hypothetical protein